MKSLEFLKPTLATTLAIVLAWLLSVRPAQAGYAVTLQQVGPDVVATGRGAINLAGLTFSQSTSLNPKMTSSGFHLGYIEYSQTAIYTGPTSSSVDVYSGGSGPTRFGTVPETFASSGSGDMVGISKSITYNVPYGPYLSVPTGYVSGTALSDSATYSGKTFATLGLTPRTYVWTWGTGANQKFTLQIGIPVPFDFNGDGEPDYLLYNVSTRQTAIWYLNNNMFMGGAFAPTLPANWRVVGGADFNRDGEADYLLYNASTRQTAIWYLSGATFIGGAYGRNLPSGWDLVTVSDFNADNKPDYLLYNAGTRQTAIWYLNNNVFTGSAYGPTLPANWRVVGVADFNRDGKADYLLYNASTRQTVIWYLSGPILISGAYGPTIASGYTLIGAADFNADGNPDYLLYNAGTRQPAIWYLDNHNVFYESANGPTLPAGWSLTHP